MRSRRPYRTVRPGTLHTNKKGIASCNPFSLLPERIPCPYPLTDTGLPNSPGQIRFPSSENLFRTENLRHAVRRTVSSGQVGERYPRHIDAVRRQRLLQLLRLSGDGHDAARADGQVVVGVIQLVRPRYGNDFHAERLFEEIYETCAFDRPAVNFYTL